MTPMHDRRKRGTQYRTACREVNTNDQYQIQRNGDHKNEYKHLCSIAYRTKTTEERRAFGTA